MPEQPQACYPPHGSSGHVCCVLNACVARDPCLDGGAMRLLMRWLAVCAAALAVSGHSSSHVSSGFVSERDANASEMYALRFVVSVRDLVQYWSPLQLVVLLFVWQCMFGLAAARAPARNIQPRLDGIEWRFNRCV